VIAIVIPVRVRHLAAITVEAGRLSHIGARLPGFLCCSA
jgi:hypothetical protein